ncbi:MAG: response regulator, partial [Deltaproteobacteria bacterium]
MKSFMNPLPSLYDGAESPLILIIDDDEDSREILQQYLKHEGYRILVANSGKTGLEAFREHQPALILLDIMMPDLDGYEVCREVKEAHSTTQIIMVTAKSDISEKVRGLDVGADDYLVKPVMREELLARVRVQLRM